MVTRKIFCENKSSCDYLYDFCLLRCVSFRCGGFLGFVVCCFDVFVWWVHGLCCDVEELVILAVVVESVCDLYCRDEMYFCVYEVSTLELIFLCLHFSLRLFNFLVSCC